MANRVIKACVVLEDAGSLTPVLLAKLSYIEMHDAYAAVQRLEKAVHREFRKRRQADLKAGNEAKRARLAKAGV